jgi:hypothetical protein
MVIVQLHVCKSKTMADDVGSGRGLENGGGRQQRLGKNALHRRSCGLRDASRLHPQAIALLHTFEALPAEVSPFEDKESSSLCWRSARDTQMDEQRQIATMFAFHVAPGSVARERRVTGRDGRDD